MALAAAGRAGPWRAALGAPGRCYRTERGVYGYRPRRPDSARAARPDRATGAGPSVWGGLPVCLSGGGLGLCVCRGGGVSASRLPW